MKRFIKSGALVWVIDRKRVRSGEGPTQVRVAYTLDDHDPTNTYFKVVGNKATHSFDDTFKSENEAKLAWFERAEAELARETARFNKIAKKLSAYQPLVA